MSQSMSPSDYSDRAVIDHDFYEICTGNEIDVRDVRVSL